MCVNTEVQRLLVENESLRNRLKNEREENRARRTHLRDSVDRTNSACTNLIKEELLMRLALATSALNRDVPKVDVALHQISLVTSFSLGVLEGLSNMD